MTKEKAKAMCDLLPKKTFDITKAFLEPSCGNGTFLCEILARKLKNCRNEKDGLRALNSLFGIDTQSDNVCETRKNLVEVYLKVYPNASEFAHLTAWEIVCDNIVCDDFSNPSTEKVKQWGAIIYQESKRRIRRPI